MAARFRCPGRDPRGWRSRHRRLQILVLRKETQDPPLREANPQGWGTRRVSLLLRNLLKWYRHGVCYGENFQSVETEPRAKNQE